MFAARQAMTEADAKSQMKNRSLTSWDGAHTAMNEKFASAELVDGEVVRLDNRIDELVIGSERAFLYTFSESGVWTKHPAAYKVVVDVLSPASGGRNGSGNTGGQGGFAGGWERMTFTGSALEGLPASVAVTIGGAMAGGSETVGEPSSFGTYLSVAAATPTAFGFGSRTYKIRGGKGGAGWNGSGSANGTDGDAGPFHPGASGGSGSGGTGQGGGHGFSCDVGQIGSGSAGGGGGGGTSAFSNGGKGGHGGWPSAPGGGGGGAGSTPGTGGNGGVGAVFVTVYVADELGVPPSTPTNLVASSVTATSAHVTWDASVDDVIVKHYVLYLNGARYGVVQTTSHDFVGLTASTAYSVRIQAVDIGDNVSELSAPLSFTTTA